MMVNNAENAVRVIRPLVIRVYQNMEKNYSVSANLFVMDKYKIE